MNNASEHDIDRVLTALRDTEPSTGLETRILHSLENRAPARSTWFRWTPSMQWGIAALATAAVILAVALTTHNTQSATPTIAQTSGDPSSPEALSPAKVGPHNAPTPNPVLSTEASRLHTTRSGEIAAFNTTGAAAGLKSAPTHPTYSPHELLCDCDRLALDEMQAPSQLAPEMPLTAQERLLQRIVHRGDPIEIAELEPLANAPLRASVSAKEDDAVKNVVQGFLKQLAAAEAINPTLPTPDPTPASEPDANDPSPSVESPGSPN